MQLPALHRLLVPFATLACACASAPVESLPESCTMDGHASIVFELESRASDVPSGAEHSTPGTPASGELTRVDASSVCMVTNHWKGRAQTPVAIEDKTYFACCAGCERRLANDPRTRVAIDPITGAELDKASALIAKNEAGRIFYFENEASLERYASR